MSEKVVAVKVIRSGRTYSPDDLPRDAKEVIVTVESDDMTTRTLKDHGLTNQYNTVGHIEKGELTYVKPPFRYWLPTETTDEKDDELK